MYMHDFMSAVYCISLILMMTGDAGMDNRITVIGERGEIIRIGELPPGGVQCGRQDGLAVKCERNRVRELEITSPRIFLDRTKITVGSTHGDVIRFYGEGKTSSRPSGIIVSYPSLGLTFELDRTGDRIRKIVVSRPATIKPSSDYETYKDLFKQKR